MTHYTPEQRQEALRMVVECRDMTYEQIAEVTGINFSTLKYWVYKERSIRRNKYPLRYSQNCYDCRHPQKHLCTQHWCACCDHADEPWQPKDVDFHWPRKNRHWRDEDPQPSPLVRAARMLQGA